MPLEFYIVVMMKRGEVLYPLSGLHLRREDAVQALEKITKPYSSCNLGIVKVALPYEIEMED